MLKHLKIRTRETTSENLRNISFVFFFSLFLGDTSANCEVHLNLEELLELQQKREPVS